MMPGTRPRRCPADIDSRHRRSLRLPGSQPASGLLAMWWLRMPGKPGWTIGGMQKRGAPDNVGPWRNAGRRGSRFRDETSQKEAGNSRYNSEEQRGPLCRGPFPVTERFIGTARYAKVEKVQVTIARHGKKRLSFRRRVQIAARREGIT